MVEVVRSSFKEQYPLIAENIRKCDFIALDTEFTGLKINEQIKSSLFDDGAERYKKLRKTITQITICQLGLSIFTKDQKENRYGAKTYNFYLYPQSFGPVDERFFCQASSLQFLCKYDFDFNKFIYEGIPHLNDHQEQMIRDHIASKAMFTGLERDLDENAIQKICSKVADWLVNTDEDNKMVLTKNEMERIPMYVLSTELRGRFPGIWTIINKEQKCIEIEKIAADKRQELEISEKSDQRQQEEALLEKMLGFTRIFRLMKQLKKPLLAHNCMMDLMLIYDKFYKPLPVSYTEFKTNLHMMFPKVFDTKHIASSVRREMEETGLVQYTNLGDLYKDLESEKGQELVLHPPAIVHAEGFERYISDVLPHEAGFDAYMCGFVFLRYGHILTFKNTKSSEVIPCMFRRYLQTLENYTNRINIIRATVNHINLEGPDQESRRPELLYVRSRMFKQKLNIDQLAKWFSPYGSVDVKAYGQSRALVATSNYSCARDILRAFKKHNTIYVTKYSVWKHSPVVRGLLWSGVLLTGSVCVLALLSGDKNS
ncbi:poly(A)-specific ribonuclease PNLDC1-like isoform X2 [Mercenaria mercenaria]|uniref:poly(A)-specific ribonuclease PNLDC1-like isoform X2 n=1 Tax=Mercenaria mercenaria TaxID=6596 RepID=UPI00234EEA76|nr:poly(A)-specific ribonuclease PNLDC1-like isoform X2 [Mercenaria mercenaria]